MGSPSGCGADNRAGPFIIATPQGVRWPEDAFDEIKALLKGNPETSISLACDKYIKHIYCNEAVVFFALIYRYWYEHDDMVGWHDIDDYFDEDVGGIKKKDAKISASRKLDAVSINRKELFYNSAEGCQVAQLKQLLSDKGFNGIRARMKDKGLRSGFTCLFYGSPGTGKTETVYQIARESGRDLFIVDVSQIKNCWVGESEKNIKDVFDKYRACVIEGGIVPILLFNEADAIFGIRQQGAERAVDKMENSIQNIILQEMEDLDGILIATTNLTENLDKAFERRFLYKVRFDKPSLEVKRQIWKSMMPDITDANAAYLADKFELSGGQIENVARKKTIQNILREGIKAKMSLGSDSSFEEYLEILIKEGRNDLVKPIAQKNVTFEDEFAKLTAEQKARYYSLEAKCATIGAFIHPDGSFAKARKEFFEHKKNPTKVNGKGQEAEINTYSSCFSAEEVDGEFFSLQKEYRTLQAELNKFKAEVDEKVAEANKSISSDSLLNMKLWVDARKVERNTYDEVVKTLKVIIPQNLRDIYEKVNAVANVK